MNTVPKFILDNYEKNRLSGEFSAIVLSVDLVGFTKITEKLAKFGKTGVEDLSNIINRIFGKSIDIIYKNFGWISTFTGDGFIALFPVEKYKNAVQSAKEIRDITNKLEIKSKHGKFKISIRSGMSTGRVNWGIIKTTHGNHYYFDGDVLRRAVKLQKSSKPGEVILDKGVIKLCKNDIDVEVSHKYFKLIGIKNIISQSENRKIIKINKTTISEFTPAVIEKLESAGEFRYITSVFLYFKGSKRKREIEQFVVKTLEIVNKYNGFLNKIDFADKGNVMLILFGAPVALENPVLNAIEFAETVKGRFSGNLKLGVAEGVAFTGIIGSKKRCEYTAIGEIVNLSSRIGEKIRWGNVSIDGEVYKSTKSRFNYSYIGKKKFKGIDRGIKIYRLKYRKSLIEKLYPGEIVGRENELLEIIHLINLAKKEQTGKLIYVEGPAGIGKSRLLIEVKRKIPKEEYNWFYLPCDSILKQSLNPLSYFIKKYFLLDERLSFEKNKGRFDRIYNNLEKNIKDKNLSEELKNYYPFLCNFAGVETENDIYLNMDAKEIYQNTIRGLIALINALSYIKPTIIEFEDIQWIDDDSINFINSLIQNIKKMPIILVLSGRDSEDNKYDKIDKNNVDKRVYKLTALKKNDCQRLINYTISAPISNKITEMIWEKGEGNPFYIEQIALFLVEKGIISINEGKYVLKSKSFDVPESISNIIISRIDRLEFKLKKIVKAASVLGRRFSIQVLSEMLKGKVGLSELKKIENKNIWKIINELTGIFQHALIRDTVYNMQLKGTLKKLHKIAAKSIEDIFSKEIENHVNELAYHYYEAEEYKKAKKYMYIAAGKAREQYKNSEALEYYEKLLSIENNKKKVIEIKLRIGGLFILFGKWKHAVEILKKTIKDAQKINDKALLAESYKILSQLYENTGRIEEAEELAQKAKSLYKEKNDKVGYSKTISLLGTIYYDKAEYEKAIDYFNEKLLLDRKIGFNKGYYDALSRLGLIYFDFGKLDMALKMFKENLKFAKKVGNLQTVSHMIGDIGLVYWRQKKYQKALKNYRKVLDMARKLGDLQSETAAAGNIGIVYQEIGDYKNAVKFLDHEYKLSKEMGDKATVGYAMGNLGLVYMDMGKIDKAIENFKATKAIADATNDPLSKAIALLSIGESYIIKNNYIEAQDTIKKSIEIFSTMKMYYMLSKTYFLYSRILHIKGLDEKSRKYLKKAEESLRNSPRDDVKLMCNILKNELLKDKTKAIKNLKELVKNTKNNDGKAEIYYTMFLMSKDASAGQKTLNIYQRLYKVTPKYMYLKRINEVKETLKEIGEREIV